MSSKPERTSHAAHVYKSTHTHTNTIDILLLEPTRSKRLWMGHRGHRCIRNHTWTLWTHRSWRHRSWRHRL